MSFLETLKKKNNIITAVSIASLIPLCYSIQRIQKFRVAQRRSNVSIEHDFLVEESDTQSLKRSLKSSFDKDTSPLRNSSSYYSPKGSFRSLSLSSIGSNLEDYTPTLRRNVKHFF